MNQTVYWTTFSCEGREWVAAASLEGLCYVGASCEEFHNWVRRQFPGESVVSDHAKLAPLVVELEEYFNGQRTDFSFPLDLRGTPFQRAVWSALREIPYGRTNAYSELAERIGKPEAIRAVGAAIGANPIWIVVPCHRVIGKNGALTGYRGGLELKRRLLQVESRSI